MKVLVVDDSLTVRMDLGEAFENAGLQTELCSSLGDARQALRNARFALIILDVMLPDGDGVDFLKELRADRRTADSRIILLSSESEVRDRLRGLATGADEYVGKPYDKPSLIARAQALLPQPKAADAPPSILLIDDSATFREALRSALEQAGYRVVTAESGESGLRTAFAVRPSAIIVDRELPGIDGPTVIRRLRADQQLRTTPCLMLTASEAGGGGELEGLESGADAYLLKNGDTTLVLAKLAAALRAASPVPRDAAGRSLLAPKRILVVDDSATYLDAVAVALSQDGYDIVPARSGEEALQFLQAQRVDCVLLDCVMPGLSGEAVCRVIKGSPAWRDIPVVLHTSNHDREAMIGGLNVGADDFVEKSPDLSLLRARLSAQLRRKQLEDESLEASQSRAARELADTRAKLLADLEAKNKRIEAANRMKSEFLANMSHELRTPLNAIIGFAEIMHSGLVDDPRQQKEYLHDILLSGQHLLGLINDVLDLSKVEAGKMEFHPQEIDLAVVINESLTLVREIAAKKRIRLKQDIEAGPFPCYLDPARMKQVLYNYLSNAIKFTPHEGVVTVRLRAEEALFRLEVIDTGIGITQDDIAKLFVEFQQLDASASKHYQGTGLGLALTKKIVTTQGGYVGVSSQPQIGSTFFVVMPRRVEQVDA